MEDKVGAGSPANSGALWGVNIYSMALPLGNEERPPTTHLIRKWFCHQLASDQDGERTMWKYSELRADLSHPPPAQPVEATTHSEGCTPSRVALHFSF